jgi:vacuolar-type H+-ATPase subunit H
VDISSLINRLDTLLQHSVRVPASGRLLIEEAAVRQILAEMRAAVPDEVRMGQQIAGEREKILADARAQAHRILEEAHAQAMSRVDDQGMVQAARERARSIIAEAEQRASALQAQANQYILTQLNNLEQRLQRVLRELQAGQRVLTQEAPGGDQPKTGR